MQQTSLDKVMHLPQSHHTLHRSVAMGTVTGAGIALGDHLTESVTIVLSSCMSTKTALSPFSTSCHTPGSTMGTSRPVESHEAH